MPASLVLPMGRFGPAFLAFDNFKVYTEWNNSLIYSLTAAYYATRLAGAPAYNRGHGRQDSRLEPSTKSASCRRSSPSAASMSAGSTAYSGSRAGRRSATCRSSSSCRPIPGRRAELLAPAARRAIEHGAERPMTVDPRARHRPWLACIVAAARSSGLRRHRRCGELSQPDRAARSCRSRPAGRPT